MAEKGRLGPPGGRYANGGNRRSGRCLAITGGPEMPRSRHPGSLTWPLRTKSSRRDKAYLVCDQSRFLP